MITETMSIATIKMEIAALSKAEQHAMVPVLLADTRKGVQQLGSNLEKRLKRQAEEQVRLDALWQYERQCRAKGFQHIVGTDEAGRGPLAGPVVAAAVILPEDAKLPGINDSKKLTAEKRDALYEAIKAQAVHCAVCEIPVDFIDAHNILMAAERAMAKATEALKVGDVLLVDGTNKPPVDMPCLNIVGGDAKSISIAAASILAKVHRDRVMIRLDQEYPGYGFAQHKGYGTAEHYEAIRRLGVSPVHRRSFRLY